MRLLLVEAWVLVGAYQLVVPRLSKEPVDMLVLEALRVQVVFKEQVEQV
jgi:hypothetical protein